MRLRTSDMVEFEDIGSQNKLLSQFDDGVQSLEVDTRTAPFKR